MKLVSTWNQNQRITYKKIKLQTSICYEDRPKNYFQNTNNSKFNFSTCQAPLPESADAPRERGSQMLGCSSLAIPFRSGVLIFHCPFNSPVPSNRIFSPDVLWERGANLTETLSSSLPEAEPFRSTFHTLRSMTGSLFTKFCQKRFFESKGFFCAPFLPFMLPFS